VRNLPLDASASALVARGSSLVRISGSAPMTLPTAPATPDDKLAAGADPFPAGGLGTLYTAFTPGVDGTQSDADLIPASDDGTGIYMLARADLFSLLCVPSGDPRRPPKRILRAKSS